MIISNFYLLLQTSEGNEVALRFYNLANHITNVNHFYYSCIQNLPLEIKEIITASKGFMEEHLARCYRDQIINLRFNTNIRISEHLNRVSKLLIQIKAEHYWRMQYYFDLYPQAKNPDVNAFNNLSREVYGANTPLSSREQIFSSFDRTSRILPEALRAYDVNRFPGPPGPLGVYFYPPSGRDLGPLPGVD